MSGSSVSEELLRQVARACFENAKALYEEAKILAERGRGARAVALAIIGLEEFSKAIVYTVAALLPGERDALIEKLPALNVHEVKHWVGSAAEVAQIVTCDWADGIAWQTGFHPSGAEFLAAMFQELTKDGVRGLIGTPPEVRKFYAELRKDLRKADASWPLPAPEYLPEVDLKNAALYVDVTVDGKLKTPERVEDRATAEILGLEWYFDQYGGLPSILADDEAWARFKVLVRS